jgi:hypothetical protein
MSKYQNIPGQSMGEPEIPQQNGLDLLFSIVHRDLLHLKFRTPTNFNLDSID